VPKPEGSPSAVVVSGGKQYRVTAGDHVLVDRLQAEPGSSVKLGRVLLLHDGDDITVGTPGVEGAEVEAKVIAHRRGPRIEVLRYKSKKRVRVHRGARADLTAVEILTVGDPSKPKKKKEEDEPEDTKAAPKRAARKPKATKGAAKKDDTYWHTRRAAAHPATDATPSRRCWA
jgi:large subunit ribosomal protein L21